MDEIQINSDGEEIIGDDFYEKIEAPKFFDLAAPDRCRTENDDRYWFCLRVGCDQKHEEEMDSEAIYKNFVLRVMAARSPSVRLRKALYRKDSSSNLVCPRTVPAKSSKSKVSKLAMISSISQKMGEAKVKVRAIPKQSVTTPNVKAAKQSSSKALTTPRNKKGLANPGTFRSVRNPKQTTIEVPKNRVVAKALVFHSPKKAVKLKKSVELRKICVGMKKLEITEKNSTLGCNKHLDGSRKQLRGREVKSRVYDSLHSQNQKKQEAKSLKSLKKKNKGKDLQLSKGPMCNKPNEKDSTEMEQAIDEKLKISSPSRSNMTSISNSEGMNSGDNDVPKSQYVGNNEINERSSHEENIEPCSKDKEIPEATETDDKENALAYENKASEGMNSGDNDVPKSQYGGNNEINERSSHEENIEPCSKDKEIPEATESDDKENVLAYENKASEGMNSGENDVPKSQNGGNNEINERSSHEENIEPCSKDKEIPEAMESDDKENALACENKASEIKVMEIDDKENASAPDENRKLNTTDKLVKKDVLGKHETSKSIQKVTKVISKTLKENSKSTVNGTQGVKYRKPKLTNPKPFRLRTDERGILKEANLEKKHLQAPLKETTTFPGSQGGNSWRKHQNVQRNEKCLGETETVIYAHDQGSDNESDTRTLKDQPKTVKTSSSRISNGTIERKLSTTPQKHTVSIHQKTKFPSLLEKGQDKAAKKFEGRFEKTKLPSIKQLVRPRGVASSRKTLVSLMKPGQLGVIKEMPPTISIPKETSDHNESGTSSMTEASASNASRSSLHIQGIQLFRKNQTFIAFMCQKAALGEYYSALATSQLLLLLLN
ncbi:hypothetical protein REPUB_Repub01dG0249100 [Reevesia pubescens]